MPQTGPFPPSEAETQAAAEEAFEKDARKARHATTDVFSDGVRIGRFPRESLFPDPRLSRAAGPDSAFDSVDTDRVKQRAGMFSLASVRENPAFVAQLVNSNVPDEALGALAEFADVGLRWLSEMDRFGGVPGLLTRARLRAIDIEDPGVQGAALYFLDTLQKLPDEQQSFLLANLVGQRASLPFAPGGTFGPLPVRLGGEDEEGQQTLDVEASNFGIDLVAAVKTLFPEAEVRVGQVPDQTIMDIADAGADAFTEIGAFGTTIDAVDYILNPPANATVGGFFAALGGAAFDTAFSVGFGAGKFKFPIGIIPFFGAGEAAEAVPFVGEPIRRAGGGAVRGLEHGLGAGINLLLKPVITPALAKAGIEEGSREYGYAFNIANFLATWGVLHSAQTGARGLFQAKTRPPAAARVTSGLFRPPAETAIGKLFRAPIEAVERIWLDPIRKLGLRLGNTPPNKWLIHTQVGRGWIGEIQRLKQEVADGSMTAAEMKGRLAEKYPNMTVDRAQMLDAVVDTPPELLVERLTQFMENPRTRSHLDGLNRRLREIEDRLEIVDAPEARRGRLRRAKEIDSAINDVGVNGFPPEGTLLNMPLPEINKYVDPLLWSRTTSMGPGKIGKLSEAEFATLRESIREHGIQEPLELAIDPTTGQAVMSEGFHRWLAAQELGLEQIPVRITHNVNTIGPGPSFPRMPEFPRDVPESYRVRAPQDLPADHPLRIEVERLVSSRAEALRFQAERVALRAEVREFRPDAPTFEYPRRFTSGLVRDVLHADPKSQVARLAHTLFVKPLRNWADDLPTRPALYEFLAPNSHPAARAMNVETMRKAFIRMRVPESESSALLGRLIDVKTRTELYDWRRDVADAFERAATKNGTRYVDPRILDEIRRFSDTTLDASANSVYSLVDSDGRTVYRGVLEGKDHRAIPSRPTELIHDVRLPSFDTMVDATSKVRHIVQVLKKQGKTGQTLAKVLYDVPRGLMGLNTTVYKGPVLSFRSPAVALRTMPEEVGRAFASGFPFYPGGMLIRQFKARKGLSRMKALEKELGRRPEEALGLILNEMLDFESKPVYAVKSNREFTRDGRPVPREHVEGQGHVLQQFANDPLIQNMVRLGLDVERIEAWFRDNRFGQKVREDLQPHFEDDFRWGTVPAEQFVRDYLGRQIEHIRQFTGNDPRLLDAVRNGGKWTPRGDTVRATLRDRLTNKSVVDEYENLQGDYADLARTVDATSPGSVERGVFQEQLRVVIAQMERIEREAGLKPKDLGLGTVDIHDRPRAFVDRLKAEIDAGRVRPPDYVEVKLNVRDSGMSAREMLALGYRNASYFPMRLLTWADMRVVRGSLYHSMKERWAKSLIDQGWSKAEARSHAVVKAAADTKALMYDLSARTSAQRALKDVFWFLPATQELLYTWFVKIPAQSYWPVGLFLLWQKGTLALDAARALGIVRRDEHGEEVIDLPGIGTVKLKGANLVATSPIPSLGTGPGFVLGKADEFLNGGLGTKELADVLMPYGPPSSLLPGGRQLSLLYETAFGKPFPVTSPLHQDRTSASAWDRSLQATWGELAEEEKPPLPGDFADQTDPTTGRPTLSLAAVDAYQEARKDWIDEWMRRAKLRFQTDSARRFLGAVSFFASITPTDTERRDYRKWWEANVEPSGFDPDGTYSQKQRDQINGYLEEHPYSFAYTVGYTVRTGDESDYPFEPTDEDDQIREYLEETRTLDPEDFAQKVYGMYAYQSYVEQVNALTKGLDGPQFLNLGSKRAEAMVEYREEWRRFLHYNPGVEAIVNEAREAFRDRYGVPTTTFEQERLSQTQDGLREMALFFSGVGPVPSRDYRAVLGQVKGLYAEEAVFGLPFTDREKEVSWYVDSVVEPYIDQTQDLHTQATDLRSRGLWAGDVYDQLRAVDDACTANPPRHGGKAYPCPHEMFYNNMDPARQLHARQQWASRPLTWTTEFQRRTLGYSTFQGEEEFLREIAQTENQLKKFVVDNGITSTKQLEVIERFEARRKTEIAAKYGDGAVKLLQLHEAPPVDRVDALGMGPDSLAWNTLVESSRLVRDTLAVRDLEYTGFSQDAKVLKAWFYGVVESLRDRDPTLDRWFRAYGYAVPDRGFDYREGVALYEALFFDNWNTRFIPPGLAEIGR